MPGTGKTYCFNYELEGVKTFLPLFASTDAETEDQAIERVKKYLLSINDGRGVTVYKKNYPESISTSMKVPSYYEHPTVTVIGTDIIIKSKRF